MKKEGSRLRRTLRLVSLALGAVIAQPAEAEVPKLTLSLTETGVRCNCGSMGAFPYAYRKEKLFQNSVGSFSVTSPKGVRLAFTDFSRSVWSEPQDGQAK